MSDHKERIDTAKIRVCSVFLGEPADTVVCQLADEIDRLTAENAQKDARIAELESKLATESDSHAETLGMYRRRVEQHEQALARIAELEAAARWRPISTAPIREAVLIYHPAHWNRLACLHENWEWYEWPTKPGGGRIAYEPFAWLPIPPFEEPKP